MRNLNYIILFTMLSFCACKSNQEFIGNKNVNINQPLQISVPAQIKIGQQLKIVLSTNLDEGIILFDPMITKIEKLEDSKWRRVRIVQCPCGANCIPPPNEKIISKNETWTRSWNLVESWCEKNPKQGFPKTNKLEPTVGKYRAVLYYGYNNIERIKLTKEFEIIN
ncbi:MAG: hypothetical protein GQ564_06750 [Bacteroidales bacterium]|nr:hypothetical protein [Bacteroidales bacterium]